MLEGLVKVGAVLSLTVIVCTWSSAALPQSSTRLQVLVITWFPGHDPFIVTSVKVASMAVEQLSASSVTSPVKVTLATKLQAASVKIVMLAGLVKVGAILSLTVIICTCLLYTSDAADE